MELRFRKSRRLGHVQQGGLDVFFLFDDLTHDSSLEWVCRHPVTSGGYWPRARLVRVWLELEIWVLAPCR